MSAERRQGVSEASAERLFTELELRFDLMSLREYRANLKREEVRLTQEAATISATSDASCLRRWCGICWIGLRRRLDACCRRWCFSMEQEIETQLVLTGVLPPEEHDLRSGK